MTADGRPREIRFEALNHVFNIIEQLYYAIISRLKLERASVERWRWDEPVATLRWSSGNVSRNVHAFIDSDSAGGGRIRVDANAWVDFPVEGKAVVRRWSNVSVGQIELSRGYEVRETGALENLLMQGVRSVSELKAEQLKNKTFLRG